MYKYITESHRKEIVKKNKKLAGLDTVIFIALICVDIRDESLKMI